MMLQEAFSVSDPRWLAPCSAVIKEGCLVEGATSSLPILSPLPPPCSLLRFSCQPQSFLTEEDCCLLVFPCGREIIP